LPRVNVELFSMALAEFAKEVGAGEERRILLQHIAEIVNR
jgi:hypothetical protein